MHDPTMPHTHTHTHTHVNGPVLTWHGEGREWIVCKCCVCVCPSHSVARMATWLRRSSRKVSSTPSPQTGSHSVVLSTSSWEGRYTCTHTHTHMYMCIQYNAGILHPTPRVYLCLPLAYYLWVFLTPAHRHSPFRSQNKEEVDEMVLTKVRQNFSLCGCFGFLFPLPC